MKPNHVYLEDLTRDHGSWRSELQLQKDQLNIFDKRLGEMLQRNTDTEARAFAEQFQNRMIRQREVIDILNHDIGIENDKLSQFAKDHPVAVDHVYFQDHKSLRERIFTNADIFRTFRKEFYAFIEKWI